MKAFGTFLLALSVPLMFLNLFGGIVSGIWLAFAGQWHLIFVGFLNLIVGLLLVPLLLLPGTGLLAIAVFFLNKNRTLTLAFSILSNVWSVIVIIAWEASIFLYFGKYDAVGLTIPIWLWSYGTATGIWTWLSNKEQRTGNEMAGLHALGAQAAYIFLSVAAMWFKWTLGTSLLFMFVPLLIPVVIGMSLFLARVAGERSEN